MSTIDPVRFAAATGYDVASDDDVLDQSDHISRDGVELGWSDPDLQAARAGFREWVEAQRGLEQITASLNAGLCPDESVLASQVERLAQLPGPAGLRSRAETLVAKLIGIIGRDYRDGDLARGKAMKNGYHALRRAAALDPTNTDAWLGLGLVLTSIVLLQPHLSRPKRMLMGTALRFVGIRPTRDTPELMGALGQRADDPVSRVVLAHISRAWVARLADDATAADHEALRLAALRSEETLQAGDPQAQKADDLLSRVRERVEGYLRGEALQKPEPRCAV